MDFNYHLILCPVSTLLFKMIIHLSTASRICSKLYASALRTATPLENCKENFFRIIVFGYRLVCAEAIPDEVADIQSASTAFPMTNTLSPFQPRLHHVHFVCIIKLLALHLYTRSLLLLCFSVVRPSKASVSPMLLWLGIISNINPMVPVH